ncbi:hypothetical protein ACIHAR_16560 [Streptomyces sp. NPDC052016]|uniref:hypothetical protein n=1 Tax=Streptomyces sp. NPDC052016 TaxID=3365680 RepID=UPI0037D69ED7
MPFTGHGSDIQSYVGSQAEDISSATVVPAARVGALDYELLRPAFTAAPTVIGLPEASFSFDPKSNSITYDGIPSPRACWHRLRTDEELFSSWISSRRSAMHTLRALLTDLGEEIRHGRPETLGRATRSLVDHLTLHGASIFLTVLFDEHVFDECAYILQAVPDDATRNFLYSRVLASRHSLAYLSVPPTLLHLKRITLPLREMFPPPATADASLDVHAGHIQRLHRNSISAAEWRYYNLVHDIYDASEELSVTWISVVSLLSASLTDLFHADLLESMQNGSSKLIDHLPEG